MCRWPWPPANTLAALQNTGVCRGPVGPLRPNPSVRELGPSGPTTIQIYGHGEALGHQHPMQPQLLCLKSSGSSAVTTAPSFVRQAVSLFDSHRPLPAFFGLHPQRPPSVQDPLRHLLIRPLLHSMVTAPGTPWRLHLGLPWRLHLGTP